MTGKCENVLDRNESNAESAALWRPIVKLRRNGIFKLKLKLQVSKMNKIQGSTKLRWIFAF